MKPGGKGNYTGKGGALEDRTTTEKFLQIISQQAQRLNRLVDDLLTLSHLELGEIKLHLEETSVAHIVENVLPVIQAKAGEKKLTIHHDTPSGLPPIMADRDRAAQVILNILDNAVKFTPETGKVSITAVEEGRGAVIMKMGGKFARSARKFLFRPSAYQEMKSPGWENVSTGWIKPGRGNWEVWA